MNEFEKNPPKPLKPGDVVHFVPNGKKVQLQLKYELGGYIVQSITNTTVVHPGQRLEPAYVAKVCDEYDNWEVTMVDNDIAAQIFGFVRGLIPIPGL